MSDMRCMSTCGRAAGGAAPASDSDASAANIRAFIVRSLRSIIRQTDGLANGSAERTDFGGGGLWSYAAGGARFCEPKFDRELQAPGRISCTMIHQARTPTAESAAATTKAHAK